MNNLFNVVLNSIDFVVVAIVLAAGFFQKRYFGGFQWSKTNESLDSALKTLALSFVVSAIYISLIKDPNKSINWAKYFLSYFFATSLYELLVQPFMMWIKKITGS